jgi:glycosyltransferase involved in cell wall biosynthesis
MPDNAPPPLPDLPSDPRPLVVLVCDSLPPYRVRVHRRAEREIPEVRLFTLCTHDPSSGGRWPTVPHDALAYATAGPGDLGEWPSRWQRHRHEWRKGGRVTAWLQRHRPAAVMVNGYNDPARLRIWAWCRARGIPLFLQGDSNVRLDRARGVKRLVKRAYVGTVVRTCAGVFPFGTLGGQYFARYGARPDRTFFVPLEPDYDLIESLTPGKVEAVRARFGLPPHRRRVLFSGRFIPEKRVDLLVRGFARVAADRPDWDLVLLGSGSLREQARSLAPPELADRYVWIDNLRDPADVFALNRCCDVLALTSEYDAWALVVNEACASGLAVVCSDVVGAGADLVRDGVNGRVFRSGDLAALAAALMDVTAESALAGMKAASAESIARWRREADPVQGLRAALRSVGVI